MASFEEKLLLGPLRAEEWEAFLSDDPPTDGIRLLLRKKTSRAPGIAYDEALELALCYGWIDGQVKRHDDDYVQQAFTPRRARSPWSQRNRDIVERLIAEGRMKPAGLAEIERAKADGRWDAAYRVSGAPVPPELQAELDARPAAAAAFAALTSQNRFAMIFRVSQAKRPETRERRASQFADMLERGERIY